MFGDSNNRIETWLPVIPEDFGTGKPHSERLSLFK
jgi:hypothetical protein